MQLYPLQFQPILKERIWGGTKLKTYLNKPITSDITGESWELSGVAGDVSVVANGYYQGVSLNELMAQFPEELLGKKIYHQFGSEFPLLFKYLDAREDLSIQVHPNDELARARHNSFGKTEMWYVMQADAGAELIVGFKEDSNAAEYLEHLHNNALTDLLDYKPVQKGDVFFLQTGTVHAIGAGMVIAEIQQTSDITYRLYDFDRTDAQGNKRELHVDLALDAINYQKIEAATNYNRVVNQANEMVDCPYFTTRLIPLDGQLAIDHQLDSFVVYMCTEGTFDFHFNHQTNHYQTGDTILVPAALNQYKISGQATLLEIFIR
jgi:mannose-6-phosphate isomerase